MARSKKTKRIAKYQDSDQRVIKNMGLFWRCEEVRWAGNRGIGGGRLAGERAKNKRLGEVDFWKQKGIYALYDNHHLVYVGQTSKSGLGSRLKQHYFNDMVGRWNMFSWFGMLKATRQNKLAVPWETKYTFRSHLADILEGIVIAVAEPPLNGQEGRFGEKVEYFLQVDDRIPDEKKQKEIINEIDGKLKKYVKKLLRAIRRNS